MYSSTCAGATYWCWRHRHGRLTPQRLCCSQQQSKGCDAATSLSNVLFGHIMLSRGHGPRLDCDAQVDPAFNAYILADDPTGQRVAATATGPCHDITVNELAIRSGLRVAASSRWPPDHGRINEFLPIRSEPAIYIPRPWHYGQRHASTAIRPHWFTGGRNGNPTIP